MFISSGKAIQLKDQIIRLQIKLQEKDEALQEAIKSQKMMAKELLILTKLNTSYTLHKHHQVMMEVNITIDECLSNLQVNSFNPYKHLHYICEVIKITGAAFHPLITPIYKKIDKLNDIHDQDNPSLTIEKLNDIHHDIDALFSDSTLYDGEYFNLKMQAESYLLGLTLDENDL